MPFFDSHFLKKNLHCIMFGLPLERPLDTIPGAQHCTDILESCSSFLLKDHLKRYHHFYPTILVCLHIIKARACRSACNMQDKRVKITFWLQVLLLYLSYYYGVIIYLLVHDIVICFNRMREIWLLVTSITET